MNNQIGALINALKKENGGHIFYHYQKVESYLQNLITFIMQGINNGHHVMIVENDRHIFQIKKFVHKRLNSHYISKLHFINNFDFYYSNGDFNPQTVLTYFLNHIDPFVDKDHTLCTWGHVEWRDSNEIVGKLEEYENEIDRIVNGKGLISVCAYDANRTSEPLSEALLRCHDVMMKDEEIIWLRR